MSPKFDPMQNSSAIGSRELSSQSLPYKQGIDLRALKSSASRVAIITRATRLTFEVRELEQALKCRGFVVLICHPDGFSVQIGAHPVIQYDGKVFELPALVLARTGAGTSPRTIILLREFQRQGIPVINAPDAIRTVMDKVLTMQRAAAEGIPIPEHWFSRLVVRHPPLGTARRECSSSRLDRRVEGSSRSTVNPACGR
jgi:hypothetical protein